MARARIILAVYRETSIIERVFDKARISEGEFIRLLEAVVDDREVDYHRVREIAAQVARHLLLARGPRLSAQSAAHEFIKANISDLLTRPRRRVRRNYIGGYTDRLTEATRREFNEPGFDSRPALRRLKRS